MSRPRVMVVAREADAAQDIANRLEGLGYVVPAIASSGEDAVKRAEAARPDLVLMDVGLAGGMKALEAAVTIRRRLSVPVVYVGAHSDDDALRWA